MKGFDDFLKHAKDTPAVLQELTSLTGSHEEYCRRFVAFGASHGYTFTEAEVDEFTDDLVGEAIKSDQLSDKELEAVAGGGKGDAIGFLAEKLAGGIVSWLDSCP